uniref:ORF5 n=1 Tax=Aliivibrio fischeri TaxID=668 RepID=Q6JHS3_ALIFS|nr:ORF5 [Aliivibrio fischeri]
MPRCEKTKPASLVFSKYLTTFRRRCKSFHDRSYHIRTASISKQSVVGFRVTRVVGQHHAVGFHTIFRPDTGRETSVTSDNAHQMSGLKQELA